MVLNPVIIGALVVQSVISKISGVAGAIAGYLITTGILVWGLAVYAEGSQIALFGIPLTQPVFIMACLIWYGFDTREYIKTHNTTALDNSDAKADNASQELSATDSSKPISVGQQYQQDQFDVKRFGQTKEFGKFCPKCNQPYNLADYDRGATHIYCSQCKGELLRN